MTVGGGGEGARVVGGLENGQAGAGVVDAGLGLALGGGGAGRGVGGGVGGAGPAAGLTPHRLEGPHLAWQAGPGRAGVVAPCLTGV